MKEEDKKRSQVDEIDRERGEQRKNKKKMKREKLKREGMKRKSRAYNGISEARG